MVAATSIENSIGISKILLILRQKLAIPILTIACKNGYNIIANGHKYAIRIKATNEIE